MRRPISPIRPTVSASSSKPHQSTSSRPSLPYREQMVRRYLQPRTTSSQSTGRTVEGMAGEIMRGVSRGTIAAGKL